MLDNFLPEQTATLGGCVCSGLGKPRTPADYYNSLAAFLSCISTLFLSTVLPVPLSKRIYTFFLFLRNIIQMIITIRL